MLTSQDAAVIDVPLVGAAREPSVQCVVVDRPASARFVGVVGIVWFGKYFFFRLGGWVRIFYHKKTICCHLLDRSIISENDLLFDLAWDWIMPLLASRAASAAGRGMVDVCGVLSAVYVFQPSFQPTSTATRSRRAELGELFSWVEWNEKQQRFSESEAKSFPLVLTAFKIMEIWLPFLVVANVSLLCPRLSNLCLCNSL